MAPSATPRVRRRLHLTTWGVYHPSLRVTDDQGASDTTSVTVTAGNTAPTAVIDSPAVEV